MYKKILLCLDNSAHSTTAIDFALCIAGSSSSHSTTVTGVHVYAAKLHDSRFAEMESGLPERYQNPQELARQREIHDDLITKGLLTISDSYMDVFTSKASGTGISTNCKNLEGRNFDEILKESVTGGYDLITLGALGLGATLTSRTGSVTRRVARLSTPDLLIVRDTAPSSSSKQRVIAVAVDGSPRSFGALKKAINLGRLYSCAVEAISAFDPEFHYTAFRSIAGVLSEEASQIFRFEEQEVLHKEIIDSGLEKIYARHLATAAAVAKADGTEITTRLLSGKATDQISKYIEKTEPFILVMGKTGLHATDRLDIGNVTEECINYTKCNLLITTKEFTPPSHLTDLGQNSKNTEARPTWSAQATETLNKIPSFAQAMAANMIEEYAIKEGVHEISAEYMYEVRKRTGF